VKISTFVTCALGAAAMTAALASCGRLDAPQPTAVSAAPVLGQSAAASAPVPKMVPLSSLINPAGKFFGVEVNGAPDSLNPVFNVAASIGRNPNLVGQYVSWKVPFDSAAATRAESYGALYYAVWEPFNTSVEAIADGASDAYITQFAKAVHAFKDPIALSFGHEMNGNWYPWGTTGTTPAEFVAAWQHIHNLFAQAGATNVIWVWNPNIINPVPNVPLEPFWPGANYVDWVGVTGYFATTGPHTFDGVYGSTMAEIREFTTEPFLIAETSVENGDSETASVDSLMSGVEQSTDVLGLVWFDYDKNGVDWTLETRPTVRAAVAGSLEDMKLVSIDQGS
jgi:mannan endo-1,4-beta-mannosidase